MDVRAVEGECGYCGEEVRCGDVWLPLECSSCHRLFHLHCLKGRRPPAMRGDRLFHFTCAYCHSLQQESWNRPHLQWVHVIHLVLYNLMVTKEGREGFFRWNEDICGFIQSHWQSLMPHRRRTQSWHSTVAGTLSVHCPSLFLSGAKQLGENGWWSLTTLSPPDPAVAMKSSKGEGRVRRVGGSERGRVEGESKKVRLMEPPQAGDESSSISPSPSPNSSMLTKFTSSHPSLTPLTLRQENILLQHLTVMAEAVHCQPTASRLKRKLKVRQQQRNHGYATFDLDGYISRCLTSTVKYIIDEGKPYHEQIIPITRKAMSPLSPPLPLTTSHPHPYHSLLERISHTPLLVQGASAHSPRLHLLLSGCGHSLQPISSPYTARLLKPYIFRSTEVSPPHVQLMGEVVSHYLKAHPEHPPYCPRSLDLCYLQREHVRAVNALLSLFFWPVDISDCLQYPDCTVVVLYGQLVVGCGCMTPDVKVDEAYISFLVVHPHFSRAGLGKMMLYHLIQSCRGKDVTLHVSVDNPAMILYQSFGFKAERYCLDFYTRYYPPSHPHSRHAYFMRLRR